MQHETGIKNRTWPKGSALPPITDSCPDCSGPLHHYIDYRDERYAIACYAKIDGKFCGFFFARSIHITGKAKAKPVVDTMIDGGKQETMKVGFTRPRNYRKFKR